MVNKEDVIDVFILDVSYEILGNEPHVVIWGVTEDNKRVLLRDRRFRPYFYAIVEDSYSNKEKLEAIITQIKKLSIPKSPILSIEVMKKRLNGEYVTALKITTLLPEYVREYRNHVSRLLGIRAVVEADIRFSMRYLIDNDIYPCTWNRFKVLRQGVSPGYRVDEEFEVVDVLGRIDRISLPNLRILAIDIEVYNPRGTPRPDRDPIIIISLMNSEKEVVKITARDKDDRNLIKEFIEYVRKYDPDIIVGYNSNQFDWPYLIDRCRHLGIKLDVSRKIGSEPSRSVYGHISIPGRVNVDLFDFAEEIAEIKVKSLDEVADYLGVMKKSERTIVPWYEIHRYWDDEKLREILLKYSEDDVVSTYGIAEKFLPFAIQLSSVTGIPLDQVGTASVGFRLEWYLMRVAYRYGELIPNRVERPYEPYRGAIVLEPRKGIHENIAVLDFSSMYPNIMIKYNIGPDTYVRDPYLCKNNDCYEVPEIGYRFLNRPTSFLKSALESLITARKSVREQMKLYKNNEYEYRLLDARQKALKILANACYGYMGWTGARWYCKECAEAVAAYGRQIIKMVFNFAKKYCLEIIYGDTDSIFVKYEPEKINMFINEIERELGLEIKIDKVYKRVFFTEAKKRYVGLTSEGFIDIVGFEAVRGDWADIAKNIQEKVAEIVLKTGDYKKAVDYVRKELEDLKRGIAEGKVLIDSFIIWKTITKPLSEYEAMQPHIAVAKQLIKMGYKVDVGDKIGYVICRGSGKISDRARPYISIDVKDIDIDYYIEHQIIPAVIRILGYFGITESHLKGVARSSKSLLEYSRKE
ncbi:MAG: DNA polymerase II [Ignisphaera sp.]